MGKVATGGVVHGLAIDGNFAYLAAGSAGTPERTRSSVYCSTWKRSSSLMPASKPRRDRSTRHRERRPPSTYTSSEVALNAAAMAVALVVDRSGSVGSIYRASSIPLTVVVGRDGNVLRIMVGLHEKEDLEDVLHEAGIF